MYIHTTTSYCNNKGVDSPQLVKRIQSLKAIIMKVLNWLGTMHWTSNGYQHGYQQGIIRDSVWEGN